MIPDPGDAGLTALLPAFRRARDCHLYDAAGRRYLDLWQCEGHAILGHRGGGITRLLKGSLGRGLVGDLPSVRSGRLARALRGLLPDHPHTRVFGSLPSLLQALGAWAGRSLRVSDLGDPATGEPPSGGAAGLWRPFAPPPGAPGAAAPEALIPVLPFSVGGGPWAACFRDDPGEAMPAAPPVSPLLLEAAASAVWALTRHKPADPGRELGEHPPIAWRVVGPYLTPRFPRERHATIVRGALESGVVLSPWFDTPCILPCVVSPGERQALIAYLGGIALE